jgi:hypothetical protein
MFGTGRTIIHRVHLDLEGAVRTQRCQQGDMPGLGRLWPTFQGLAGLNASENGQNVLEL